MMNAAKSDSFDSEGNLVVRRQGIRIAMGLALLASLAFFCFTFLSHRESLSTSPLEPSPFPDSLERTTLWVALPLVPFILSGSLVSFRREEAIAAGVGIAAALFLDSLLFSIGTLAGSMLTFGRIAYALPMKISIVAFSACSIWIIAAAFRIARKAGWGMFLLTLAATLVGMALAYRSLGGY
jgi:hypothetical protein